jgi:hypothetical protein
MAGGAVSALGSRKQRAFADQRGRRRARIRTAAAMMALRPGTSDQLRQNGIAPAQLDGFRSSKPVSSRGCGVFGMTPRMDAR